MRQNTRKRSKILVSLLAGLVVAVVTAVVDVAIQPLQHGQVVHQLLAAFVAGLLTVIVCLAIQLRQEEVHYQTAMDRAAIVSELNHHVRNAIFPLCLAVQKLGDNESTKLANEAVERINIALKDATADALSGRVDYGPSSVTSIDTSDRAA
jgi:ABC-type transport system involved in cytochrome bd biosynthesis fused ATPase/permease subunit